MRFLFVTKLYLLSILVVLVGCAPSGFISKQVKNNLLNSGDLENAHVGISIFDATANKSLYQYQSDKYFVPASNIKLLSCYAALKYLGDSLPGIYYHEDDTAIFLVPSGDPTLLHRDFSFQPVIKLLQQTRKNVYITDQNWSDSAFGAGWSWDDYNSSYMTERSALPVYGNVVRWVQERDTTQKNGTTEFNNPVFIYSIPEVNWKVRFNAEHSGDSFFVRRKRDENEFLISEGKEVKKEQDVPFLTRGLQSALELMKDTVSKELILLERGKFKSADLKTIHSQPIDSFLRPMMHRSDNFFAEQTLLMVSQQILKTMSTSRIIDTLLKSDLKDLPQRPRWVDGSGLSRYNLFTPEDFVWLLNKMKNEFGLERLKKILPTGGTGTLTNYFKNEAGLIYGKTGTLSGQVALSGILFTKKNKVLIFSLLVNNHNTTSTAVRRQTEAFIKAIREHY